MIKQKSEVNSKWTKLKANINTPACLWCVLGMQC